VHLEELDEDGRGDEFGGNKGNAHADVGIGPWNQEEEEQQESEGRAGLLRHGSLWRSSTDAENGWTTSGFVPVYICCPAALAPLGLLQVFVSGDASPLGRNTDSKDAIFRCYFLVDSLFDRMEEIFRYATGRTADLTQVRSAPPTCKRTPHCKDGEHAHTGLDQQVLAHQNSEAELIQ
ncbi:hypothetical protein BHE74_00050317, partial [Ensete ventricosum]